MAIRRRLGTGITGWGLILFCVGVAGAAQQSLSDEAPMARAYLNRLLSSLDEMRRELPNISRSAEAAAKALVAGKGLGVRGEPGLASELSHRTGGLALYDGSTGGQGDVLLFVLGQTTREQPEARTLLEAQLAEAAQARQTGSLVIALASQAQLRHLGLLERAEESCDFVLDNHAPAQDGFLSDSQGRHVVPTFTTANAVLAWTWCAELFAACTRLGHTPVIHPERQGPRQKLWPDRRWGLRFHEHNTLAPIAEGTLGAQYLTRLGGVLRDIGTAGYRALAATTRLGSDTLRDQGAVFLRGSGPYLPFHHAGQLAADPRLFTHLDHDGSNRSQAGPGSHDLVIAFGHAAPPGTDWWGEPELLRDAGRGVCWVVSGYLTKAADLHSGELLVDQCWPPGDALVTVPGYDVRLAPASGVAAETILWMIVVQVYADLTEPTQARSDP